MVSVLESYAGTHRIPSRIITVRQQEQTVEMCLKYKGDTKRFTKYLVIQEQEIEWENLVVEKVKMQQPTAARITSLCLHFQS